MRFANYSFLLILAVGTAVSYCANPDSMDSGLEVKPVSKATCDPETYSEPGSPALEIYRGPKGAVPQDVWSLHTPSFGSYMSRLQLQKLAPDYLEWFADFLYEDFKDGEPRFRQNLACDGTTKSCRVSLQRVMGGVLESTGNRGFMCKPEIMTQFVGVKSISDWDAFEKMLAAFDVRPKSNGTFVVNSAYCHYSYGKLFCDIDTPVDTLNGFNQMSDRVWFSNQVDSRGEEINLAERLYNMFEGTSSLSKATGITWDQIAGKSLVVSCGPSSSDYIPGFIESRLNNFCILELSSFNKAGVIEIAEKRIIDLREFNDEIGEILVNYDRHIGDETGYPIKRKGSFYFSDLKCYKSGSSYKCNYKKI